ncbi:Mg-dependent DNase [Coniophora puteana RWD-64-598 SS2]|uniref:Mg-dependent DNase n=1 Tax=Coniophora puteana (strain RWD-64-598) TaxID=741705 RepID=A0A5M3N7Q8_CONPW|nr:Mg-dependent DNase [Coniophora puteana RWD-64-598 SS2]EIW86875.1 Mg-dependent DNase [Coniophora puteana RWD-64-598 SS2]
MSVTKAYRFIDIGVNLTDPVFRGIYHGRKKHEDDFLAILERSRAAGVKSMIVTGGSLSESTEALKLAEKHGLYATIGCHPTRSSEFDKHPEGPLAYLDALDKLLASNGQGKGRGVAIGECGLDYDRTHFAAKDVQQKAFRLQLGLAKKYHMPLFLHSRAAHQDFVQILREEGLGENGGQANGAKGGVVHSFTGTSEEMEELMNMGFHIGFNGCSLKTDDNLRVVKGVRLDKLLLETDAPWCSMTTTQASRAHIDTLPADLRAQFFPSTTKPESFVHGKPTKGRNEPTAIGGVAWVVHKLHPDIPFENITEMIYKNTVDLFGLEINATA